MCGRYALQMKPPSSASSTWCARNRTSRQASTWRLRNGVPILRAIDGTRRLETLRWGLIPFFAKGEPPKYSTINARIETVETAASYRGPWSRGQRCLQIATGFFNGSWTKPAEGDLLYPPQRPTYVRVCPACGTGPSRPTGRR